MLFIWENIITEAVKEKTWVHFYFNELSYSNVFNFSLIQNYSPYKYVTLNLQVLEDQHPSLCKKVLSVAGHLDHQTV